jgi:hypothetical protein
MKFQESKDCLIQLKFSVHVLLLKLCMKLTSPSLYKIVVPFLLYGFIDNN